MGSVYEEITRLETAKADIETAIEGCGVNVPDTDLISTYALYIRQIPSAVFSELDVDPVGGEDQYIQKIELKDGLINATAGGLVSSTSSGIVPKIVVSSTTINNQTNDWILTSTSGNTPAWKKLPTSAFYKYVGTTELQATSKAQELTGIKNIIGENSKEIIHATDGYLEFGKGFSDVITWFNASLYKFKLGNTQAFIITTDGKVGIGDVGSAPKAKLHVAGGSVLADSYHAWSGGFSKEGCSDAHILLAGGGHKSVSDFAAASHSHSYLPLAGGLMNSDAYISWNSGDNGNDVADWKITGNGLRIISSTTTTSSAPTQYSTALHVRGRYGFQLASAGGVGSNSFYIRNISNDNWNALIHSGNIGSQSVNYATSAGSIAWGNVSGRPDMNKYVPKNYNNIAYSDVTAKYVGSSTPTYFRITFPDKVLSIWNMVNIEIFVRLSYENEYGGKILICTHNNSWNTWNPFRASTHGPLTTSIKVYGSEGKYIYIGGCGSYSTISIDKILIGDAATNHDISDISIDYVTALPSTYQTATMYYDINSLNIGSQSVNYATSAGNADNSDKLDGIDSTGFLRKVTVANNAENDFNTFESMTLTGRGDPTTGASLKNAPWSGQGPAGGYGVLTYLWSGYGTQLAWGYNSNRIYIRSKYYSSGAVWSSNWDSLALTSDLKNPTDYYWANVKVSASSSTSTNPTFASASVTDRINATNYVFLNPSGSGIYLNNNSLNWHTNTSYQRSLLCFTSDGNVGIGITPSYKLDVDGSAAAKIIYANKAGSDTDGGISLYSSSDPMTYGIAFRGTGTYGTHGSVTSDWATYFTMNDQTDRGWIFRRYNTNVASISSGGNVKAEGSVTAKGFIHYDYWSSAYALTSNGGVAHIGSMSVNYANSAGTASQVTCTEASGDTPRPIVGIVNNLLYYTSKVTIRWDNGNVTAPTFTGRLIGSADQVDGYHISVVTSLPATKVNNTIYILV